MGDIRDLDLIFPDKEPRFKFSGREDEQEYTITMFIPHGLTLIMQDKKISNQDKQIKYLAVFLQAQHPNMNEEWIKRNLSLQKQNAIFNDMLREVGRSNDFLSDGGALDMLRTEAVKAAVEMMQSEEKKEPM